jgi:hypothetical protein
VAQHARGTHVLCAVQPPPRLVAAGIAL